MKDPYYTGLLFQIEQIICQADETAKGLGIQLTDSQIRSALIKTRKKAAGADPEIPLALERDRILAGLIDSLLQAPGQLGKRVVTAEGEVEKPLPLADWTNALETVEDSIKTRKSNTPGSRHYLDFVHGFIAQAKRPK